jgi:hypothetical protein
MDSRENAPDDASERRLDRLLGALDHDEPGVGREKLEAMADAALKDAAISEDAQRAVAPLLEVTRRWTRIFAAAAVVLAVAWGGMLVFKSRLNPSVPPEDPAVAAPPCLDDPEFVRNFDVIRDLPDLDAEGEALDLGEEALELQALEGA